MNCIILGDKFQKGMKSKGCAGLININKTTNILQNQYCILRSVFKDIVIAYVYGFDGKKFLDFCSDSDIITNNIFNEQYQAYNQAFSLSLAKEMLNNDILVIDGYIKLTKGIFKKFDPSRGSQVFIRSDISNYESVGCIINNNMIENFSFDLSNTVEPIYFLEKNSALKLKDILFQDKYKNCFIFELLNMVIDAGHIIKPKNLK